MKLFDVNFNKIDELDPLYTLKKLFDVTGNCIENGLLAEDFTDCGFNEEHRLEYSTGYDNDGFAIASHGVVLPSGVLIKQVRSLDNDISYNLYSWDIYDNTYTNITFDNENALNNCFDTLKDKNISLSDANIEETFNSLGLSVDGVKNVLQNQHTKTVTTMPSSNDDIIKKGIIR